MAMIFSPNCSHEAGSNVELTRNYLLMLICCTGIVRVVQFAPTWEVLGRQDFT